MAQESFPEVALPADCTPFTSWFPWDNDGVPDGRKFRGIYGREFGDRFVVKVSAAQFDDGTVEQANLSIESRHHKFAPGCLGAADACQLAANLLAGADEIDRLNGWTGE